jgi:hypothetical protein
MGTTWRRLSLKKLEEKLFAMLEHQRERLPHVRSKNAETKEVRFRGATHGLRESTGVQSASTGFRPSCFQCHRDSSSTSLEWKVVMHCLKNPLC